MHVNYEDRGGKQISAFIDYIFFIGIFYAMAGMLVVIIYCFLLKKYKRRAPVCQIEYDIKSLHHLIIAPLS